ncbi:BrxA family protein [Vibrio campbellii]|uniref:BrxA family protein n=1 Tax=Vibrio parahaemolyticus TaxID=670 RepID=UPI002152C042|nr:BrxA family protein [Vibrio parahaemolyticus]
MTKRASIPMKTFDNQAYNTSVKDIAGLADYTVVFDCIVDYFNNLGSAEDLKQHLDIRTEKTKNKVTWALNKTVLQFLNDDHEAIIRSVYQSDIPVQDKKFVFLWHLCLNNRLIREITVNVFSKVYFSGRAQISQDDIIGYVRSISSKDDPTKPLWSEDTLYRVATKYLSLMTKFDFVTTGRLKSFNLIKPSTEAQILFLYLSRLYCPDKSNMLESELLPISFIGIDDIQERLKKLSMKGFFSMSFNGVILRVELTHSYKEICNAIYVRT